MAQNSDTAATFFGCCVDICDCQKGETRYAQGAAAGMHKSAGARLERGQALSILWGSALPSPLEAAEDFCKAAHASQFAGSWTTAS